VYRLQSLAPEDLSQLLQRALATEELTEIHFPEPLQQRLIEQVDGDARRLLNLLELAADLASQYANTITPELLNELFRDSLRRFDKGGDIFYDQISALHKSVRGSDADGALYWFARMLDGGADPLYIARRVVRMASEDIGNADPRALRLALDAWDVQERLGSPEGELAIAQAIVVLAIAAKSNAVYMAYNEARRFVAANPTDEVPVQLRNAPTALMKEQGHGLDYHYAHDYPEGFVAGESYFPESIPVPRFYTPVDRGLEIRVQQKLAHLQALNKKSAW